MLKFYPSKLKAVLGINQMQFTSRLASLTQALPASLLAQLKYTLSFAERVDLLESFLLRAFQRSARPTHYVRSVHQAIADYQASSLQPNSSSLTEYLFLTTNTINLCFHRVVGTAPSRYFVVLRARTALTACVADPLAFAPEDYGYYDRSHFAKAIRQFMGQSLLRATR